MKIIQGQNTFIKSWCDNPESGALDQARNLTKLPNIFKHVVLLPDTHQGYGMMIGGVVALDGMISPNMVGKDIGCSVSAIKTSLKKENISGKIKNIMSNIRKEIPFGSGNYPEVDIELLAYLSKLEQSINE